MSVPLLRLNDKFDSYISGEVNIHPSAAIAPGVILQAAANSKIIIGPGVCIGIGSILQVNEGILEIEAGASLGAGFLMVGQGKIGANACIGAATTIFNCSVAAEQVIASGSILGDSSRHIDQNQLQEKTSTSSTTETDSSALELEEEQEKEQEEQVQENLENQENPENQVTSSTQFSATTVVNFQQKLTSIPPPSPTPKSQSPPVTETNSQEVDNDNSTLTEEKSLPGSPETNSQESEISPTDDDSPNTFGTQIYGQGSINRLLSTLFPHRQSLSDEDSDNLSE